MRFVFVLLLFTVLGNGQWIDDLKLKNDEDNPRSRVERAAKAPPAKAPPAKAPPAKAPTAPVPQGKAAKSPVTELLTRHKKLARVFNVLFLNIGLQEETIDSMDVVTDLWNIENRTTIEMLVSLNTVELAGILKTLDDKVKAVPDGLTEIVNVDDIRGKFKIVESQMTSWKGELIKSDDENNIPQFVRNSANISYQFSSFRNLETDLAKNVSTLLEAFVTADSFDDVARNTLEAAIRKCLTVQDITEVVDGEISVDFEETESLLETFRVAAMFENGRVSMNELSSSFSNILTKIQPFKSLKNGSDPVKNKKAVLDFHSIFKKLQQPNTEKSLVPMFVSDRKLTVIRSELNESFVKNVLNNGDSLEALEDFFKIVNVLSTRLSKMAQDSDIILADNSNSLNSLSEFVIAVNSFQQLSPESQLKNLSSCFKVEKISAVNVAVDFVNSWQIFRDKLPSIRSTLKSIKDLKQTENNIIAYAGNVLAIRKNGFDDFKTSEKYKEMKTFFENLSTDVFGPLKQDSEFIAAVNILMSAEILNSFKAQQTWAFAMITKNKLHTDDCKSAFKFDPDSLAPLNEIPKTVTDLKTNTVIDKLQSLLQAIPKVKTGLQQLSSPPPRASPAKKPSGSKKPDPKKPASKTPKSKSKRSTSDLELDIRYPEMLLVFADGVQGLEKLNQLNQLDKDVDTVLQKGDDVVAAIQNVQDPRKKAELDKIWTDFPAVNASLTSLKDKSKKALALVKAQKSEKNLKEIGKVYKAMLGVKFTETIQLRQLRRSMKLLDTPNPEVEKALANLEEPASGNWSFTYARFELVPDSLDALQKEFDTFFEMAAKDGTESAGGFVKFLEDNKLYFMIGGGVFLLLLLGLIPAGCIYCKVYRDPEMSKKLERDADYVHDLEDKESIQYSYMQLQDARLPINKLDPKTKDHPMFAPLSKKDWEGLKKLVRDGCVIDARVNVEKKLYRTVLHEIVLMRDQEMCKWMLTKAADQTLNDSTGEDSDEWADAFGMMQLFEYHYKLRENQPIPRILPKEPRPWNVLFFDKKCIPRKMRKKLPLRIKKQCTWGYRPGMDLDKFTHIVLTDEMVKKKDTLLLDNENVIRFKLLACWANLMEPDWVHALIDDPDVAMRKDFKHYVLHCEYKKQKHEKSVFKHKTDIHRIRPPLLEGVTISFLETADQKLLDQQKDWIEVIKMFGGSVAPLEKADELMEKEVDHAPYHTMFYEYHEVKHLEQNTYWLLKYPDSKPKQEWIDKFAYCTLTNFQFLPECLARYYILELTNQIVPLAVDEEEWAKKKAEEEKNKAQEAATNSTTTTNTGSKSSMASTMSQADGKKRLGKIGLSREKGELKPKKRPAYSLMKAPTV